MFDPLFFDPIFFSTGGETPPTPVTFGGGYLREPKEPVIIPIDDDDDILLAWFMFMRQP